MSGFTLTLAILNNCVQQFKVIPHAILCHKPFLWSAEQPGSWCKYRYWSMFARILRLIALGYECGPSLRKSQGGDSREKSSSQNTCIAWGENGLEALIFLHSPLRIDLAVLVNARSHERSLTLRDFSALLYPELPDGNSVSALFVSIVIPDNAMSSTILKRITLLNPSPLLSYRVFS